jgi:diguanylate cyclase (GGDEF)-like protein
MSQTLKISSTPAREFPGMMLQNWWNRLSVQDLFNCRRHSQDFKHSRAGYLHARIRPLALVFAILMPLWIPVDYAVLQDEHFIPLLVLRLLCSLLFLLLFLWRMSLHLLVLAYLRLSLLILIPLGFYLSARIFLGDSIEDGVLIGYSFFPFMLAAMLAVFPLTLSEGILFAIPIFAGTLLLHLHSGTLYTHIALHELWLLTLLTGIALWAEMAQLHMLLRLYRQATRDAVTGLFNRRVLVEGLQNLIRDQQKNPNNFSVIIMDLDRFKRINDSYGHLTGDAVLRRFAQILETQVREHDIIGRYGGEEFLAILPRTNLTAAERIANNIRLACDELHAVYGPDKQVLNFTVSAGVGEFYPGEALDPFLARIDEALYTAKGRGRNCVVRAAT